MRGCALFVVTVTGCSALEYPRETGETYYVWLESSYSPVIQFHEDRLEGKGICIHVDGGKAQLLGFVTLDDISSAAKRDPDLCMRARAYQQAFAEGMAKGMADTLSESAGADDRRSRLAEDLDAPTHLKKYSREWRGWRNGYGYGEYISRTIVGKEVGSH